MSNELFAVKAINKDVILEGDDVDMIMLEKNILALGTKVGLVITFTTINKVFVFRKIF